MACAHADQLATSSVSERVRGYQDALKEAGIAPLPELQKPTLTASDLLKLHEKSPSVPAVFAIHDYLAIEIWGEALEAGLDVPSSLGIMGFGGFGNVFSSAFPINTVVQDLKAMGREAFRLLRALIERPSEIPADQSLSVLPCRQLDQLPVATRSERPVPKRQKSPTKAIDPPARHVLFVRQRVTGEPILSLRRSLYSPIEPVR